MFHEEQLDPYIDDHGLLTHLTPKFHHIETSQLTGFYMMPPLVFNELRVGGRLISQLWKKDQANAVDTKTCYSRQISNQVVPRENTSLWKRNYNESNQVWILDSKLQCSVGPFIVRCVKCRCPRGNFQLQKMASLPKDKMYEEPPFSYHGVDHFGQFVVRGGEKK